MRLNAAEARKAATLRASIDAPTHAGDGTGPTISESARIYRLMSMTKDRKARTFATDKRRVIAVLA